MDSLDCLKIIAKKPSMHSDLPNYLMADLFFSRMIQVNPKLGVLELTAKGKKALLAATLKS